MPIANVGTESGGTIEVRQMVLFELLLSGASI